MARATTVHGIDYNYNHVYDFKALGVSDPDKTLPGEATAPVLCGPLRRAPGTRIASVASLLSRQGMDDLILSPRVVRGPSALLPFG